MKRSFRVALITVASVVGIVVLAVALAPLLFRDRIVERVKVELNERLEAEVAFSDVDLTLLSTFPTLTVRIDELTIRGKGAFEGIELLRAQSLAAGVDLMALIFDETIEIRSVLVDEPMAHIVVTADGAANYDILGELEAGGETESSTGTDLVLELEDYEIRDGALVYEEPGVDVAIVGLAHRGRFRLEGGTQALRSKTVADQLSVRLGGIRYLKNAHAELDVEALIEGEQETLTIQSLALAVNELAIDGSGTIRWRDDVDLDLQMASREGLPIKALISAIPNAYAADFDGLQASGTFSLRASVQGRVGADDAGTPSFEVKAQVRNGKLKYPDLPLGITGIELDANIDHPGGHLDKVTVDVAKYAFTAGESSATGSVRVRRPLSGPNVDLVLNGRLNLAELATAYPLPDVEALTGVIAAKLDLSAQGKQISKLTGTISANDVTYQPQGASEIRVSEAQVALSPKQTTIQKLEASVGTSDASIRGVASPLTTFLSDDQKVTASLWVRSKRLRVEDILGDDGGESQEQGAATAPFVLPDDLDANLNLDVETLTYGELTLKNLEGSGRLRNRKLTLDDVKADALGGSMKLDGTLVTHPSRAPAFDMAYVVDRVSFAETFEALPSMRAYAPIARFLDGRFSTDLRASGTLGNDLAPKLDSIDAAGLFAALQSKLASDFPPLQELNRVLPAFPKPLHLEGVRSRFRIEDGTMEVKPFTTRVEGMTLMFSGRHGLNQEMKYELSTDVPIDSLPAKLATDVRRLGLDLSKVKDVGVTARLTGSIKAPRVAVDVDTAALRGLVADTVSAELAAQRARALEEAQRQADAIVREAATQAARIRQEAKRAAERIRQEGYARADELEREAAGKPLREIAAKEGAKRIRRETDKRADQAIAEANRRADQVVAQAQERADQVMREASARSQEATDEAQKRTTDKMR